MSRKTVTDLGLAALISVNNLSLRMAVSSNSLGKPSQATQAMEMGFDGILLNTAIAKAQSPKKMAYAFKMAIESGRIAFEAGAMVTRQTASPSTPVLGTPFWQQQT